MMAEVESPHNSLKKAILQVRRHIVGAQSIQELWIQNIWDFLEFRNSSDQTTQYLYTILRKLIKVLCKHVFQRNISKYFDNCEPFQLKNSIVSGSWSEGLFLFFEYSEEITPPDIDFMCVLENINFTTSDQICGNLTVREDTPFVKAYITEETCATLWKDFLHDSCDHSSSNKHQLSSFKLKEKLRENYYRVGNLFRHVSETAINHAHSEPESAAFKVNNDFKAAEYTRTTSPYVECMNSVFNAIRQPGSDFLDIVCRNCKKLTNTFLPSTDIVLALSCDGWPLSAKEWITRERNWPDEELVNKVAQGGFHIVPKSSPEGDFRLSFSFAETTLIKHWSPLQHKVMRSFKAVVKCHQSSWSSNSKEIISTYHLKTIAFWHFEKTAQDSFTEDTVVTHLVSLLQELAEALMKLELPMYFMPKVNLLKSVENYEEVVDIVEKIFHLSEDFIAITRTVTKLRKIDISNSAREDLLKQVRRWKDGNEGTNSDLEYNLWTYFVQNDNAKPEHSGTALIKINKM